MLLGHTSSQPNVGLGDGSGTVSGDGGSGDQQPPVIACPQSVLSVDVGGNTYTHPVNDVPGITQTSGPVTVIVLATDTSSDYATWTVLTATATDNVGSNITVAICASIDQDVGDCSPVLVGDEDAFDVAEALVSGYVRCFTPHSLLNDLSCFLHYCV